MSSECLCLLPIFRSVQTNKSVLTMHPDDAFVRCHHRLVECAGHQSHPASSESERLQGAGAKIKNRTPSPQGCFVGQCDHSTSLILDSKSFLKLILWPTLGTDNPQPHHHPQREGRLQLALHLPNTWHRTPLQMPTSIVPWRHDKPTILSNPAQYHNIMHYCTQTSHVERARKSV